MKKSFIFYIIIILLVSIMVFSCKPNPIGVPKVTGDEMTNDNTPTWSWTSITEATKYRYSFDETDWNETSATSYTPTTSLDDGSYTLFVQAGNDDAWSMSGSFTTTIDTTAPSLTPTVTGETLTNDKTPTWSWNDIAEATKYRYSFNESTWSETTDTSYTPTSDLNDGEYTLYVQTGDDLDNWNLVSGSFTTTIDSLAPTVTDITPTDSSLITIFEGISVIFDESMDTSTLAITGIMSNEYNSPVEWVTDTNTDDKLIISPSSSWLTGTDRDIIINCKDLAGNAVSEISLSYDIEAVVYVNDDYSGGDSSGSIDRPYTSIVDAFDDFSSTAVSGEIRVAQGDYPISSELTLIENVSVYGGYQDGDWNTRDFLQYITTIQDTRTTGGSTSNPNKMIYGNGTITNSTIIDGFVIDTGSGSRTCGIHLSGGASPTISKNIIYSGTGSEVAYGMYIMNTDTSPIITYNIISAETSNLTYALYNTNNSMPKILNNTIYGGDGTQSSYAVNNFDNSSPIIINNVIDGGGNGSTSSYGIRNYNGCDPKIYNNTINGGSASTAYGIYNYGDYSGASESNPDIKNNIIFATSPSTPYGIYEDKNGVPIAVENNDIFDCYFYYDYIDTSNFEIYSNISDMEYWLNTSNVVTGNDAIDPTGNISEDLINYSATDDYFVDFENFDWHLVATTPITVTEGASDLSSNGHFPEDGSGNKIDKDGVIRTASWSIGAYELD